MGYVEKILGDNEHLLYRTHQHAIVLVQRVAGWLFAFLVFVAAAVLILTQGDDVRSKIGIIALFSLVLPVYAIVRGWKREEEQGDRLKQAWRPILAGVLILLVALTLMFKPAFKAMWIVAALVALIPLLELVRGILDWVNERYIITDRRVMEIRGIFNKLVRDSALEKVNDVELKQSVVGRLFRYGTVQIITGSDVGVNLFHRISNPVRFKRAMLNAKELLHARSVDISLPSPSLPAQQAATPAPGAPGSAGNIADRLIELTELRQKNVISEAEFQAKRKELLDQL
ncbi:MAG: PH domain-containing protein [Anaerolineae bacterium]|nr:PH domain-containing protein [Anaerolineae bacterium]